MGKLIIGLMMMVEWPSIKSFCRLAVAVEDEALCSQVWLDRDSYGIIISSVITDVSCPDVAITP